MEIRIEKRRFYQNQERYEWCRKCKLSGMPVATFAKENGLNRETLRDQMNAYNNINGKFINVNNVSEKEKISDEAIQLNFSGAKGGINGNRKNKNEEWLNVYR